MASHLPVRFQGLPRWQRLGLVAGLGILLYTLVGFLLLPPVVRMLAERQLARHLKREVHIEAVRLNPYTLSATVRNMTVLEPGGRHRLAAFRELFANLQSVSLFRWAPVFKEVRLDGLYAFLALHEDRRWNISDLLPAPAPEAAPPVDAETDEKKPFRFSFNNIQLTGSEIHFQDDIRGQTHHVTGIDIALPFLSNLPAQVDIFVTPRFSATVNGTPFDLQGRVKPFAGSRETELLVDLEGIDLAAYMPYLPPEAGVRIRSGLLDVKLSLIYEDFEDGRHALHSAGMIVLRSLALTDAEDRPLAALDQLRFDIAALEPMEGIVRIQEILLRKPSFTITRLPSERVVRTRDAVPLRDVFREIHLPPPVIDIAQITLEDARLQVSDLKPAPAARVDGERREHTLLSLPRLAVERTTIDVERQAVTIGTVDGRGGILEIRRLPDGVLNLDLLRPRPADAEASPSAPAGDPWQIDAGRVALAESAVHGRGLVPDDPVAVTVDAIELEMTDFSTRPETRTALAFSCRINETGHLETRTILTVQPLAAEAQLAVDRVELAAFDPFLKPYLGVVLAEGELALTGNLALQTGPDGAPAVVYRGRAAIRDFRTLERQGAHPFVGWQALSLGDVDVGVNPAYLTIGEIHLEQPSGRVVIDEAGRLNLVTATTTAKETAASGSDAAPAKASANAVPVPISIGVFQGRNGTVAFADRRFSPGFQTTFKALDFTFTGLSSEDAAPAGVDIRGRLDGHAPVAVTGTIQPLAETLAADLTFDFQQIDLTAASPYAGRYVGRTIRQGKLSVESAYRIQEGVLKADHAVRIDQFDFGGRVASPDDLNLPVDLAVALLKDRHGEIRFDLPASGNLADPEFSIGGIVLKAFVNLVVKAAASPFALLGGVFAGEDSGHLAFAPGAAVITPASREKLDALAQALYDRPALRLEIAGYADPDSDAPALADVLFRRKLQAQKALRPAGEGRARGAVEEIAIAPEEYEALLQAAYEAESFKKPRNFIGMVKTLPPAEAEALMRRHIRVGRPELEELAYARARVAKDYLLASGKVAAERVFLVKPENVLAPEVVEGQPPSRVGLGLK